LNDNQFWAVQCARTSLSPLPSAFPSKSGQFGTRKNRPQERYKNRPRLRPWHWELQCGYISHPLQQPCNAARICSAVKKLDTAEVAEAANRNSSHQQKLHDILHAEPLVRAKKLCDWNGNKFTMAMPSNKDGTDSGGNGSCGNRCNGTNVVATKAVAAAKHHTMRQCTACSQVSVPHILVLPIDF